MGEKNHADRLGSAAFESATGGLHLSGGACGVGPLRFTAEKGRHRHLGLKACERSRRVGITTGPHTTPGPPLVHPIERVQTGSACDLTSGQVRDGNRVPSLDFFSQHPCFQLRELLAADAPRTTRIPPTALAPGQQSVGWESTFPLLHNDLRSDRNSQLSGKGIASQDGRTSRHDPHRAATPPCRFPSRRRHHDRGRPHFGRHLLPDAG